ncbi:MAG TPA: helix-turn-helix domain-containing protein [Draconibacterium sp.]|nr:helix-turn-helix domain-containing protein [Draconibacterium sp.]
MNNNYPVEHAFIATLKEIILANLGDENFGVKELAKAAGMNYFLLNRKLHSILNKNTGQFIREIRLQFAKEMLERKEITVSEVAYKVGFGSPAYFNRCFHEYFGYSPGEIKKKGNGRTNENIESSLTPLAEEKVYYNSQKSQPIQKKINRKVLIFTVSGVLILAILFLLYFLPLSLNSTTRLNPEDKSIAVLPFKNLSNDTDNQYFADGMMEEILNHLNQIGQLRVISRTSVEQFRGNTKSAPEIAKKLGVNFILEGSVLQHDGKVRIMVNLIDARLDQYILTEQYDRELSDIFQIQSDIAKQVSSALNVVISSKVIKRIEKIHTRNMEAYSCYLKGLFFLNRRGWGDLEKSTDNFEKAIAADPDFAEAYSGMAEVYYVRTYRKIYPRPEGYIKSKELALKALELDNNLAEAHATIGAILAWNEWKWEEAAKECELAIGLNPNSATAHQYYADILIVMNRPTVARQQIDIAARLSPTSTVIYLQSANYYLAEGKCEDGLKECQKIIELNPPDFYSVYYAYFELYKCLGNELKAVESLQKAFSFIPEDEKYISKIKEAYDQSGMTGLLRCWIEEEKEDPEWGAIGASQKYAILGEKEMALNCLEEAFKLRIPALPNINYDLRFDNIRHEHRFQALLDSMRLKQYQ